MTLSRILNAAAGVLGGQYTPTTTTTTRVPITAAFDSDAASAASAVVDRLYPSYYAQYPGGHQQHFAQYAQNPYLVTETDADDSDLYHLPYGLHNQGFHVKYGMADPGTGYGAQQPASHSYAYGAPAQAATGYGAPQQHYHQPVQHHYPAPAQTYHHYSAPVVSHSRTHKWLHGGSSHGKSNASAMSALTLLAFLFFLNILQSCLKEHMLTMNPTVMVMTAGAGRRAAFKSNLDLKLPNDDDSTGNASASTSSADEALSHRTADYSIHTPDVDGKMFVDEFESTTASGEQPHQFILRSAAARSNRTIQAKLMRDARFGHVLRRT